MSQEGYLRHVHALNPPVSEPFVPWAVDNKRVGWVRPQLATWLVETGGIFVEQADGLSLRAALATFEDRTAALLEVSQALHRERFVHDVLGEPYPVTAGGREAALCSVDRGSVACFGIRSFGQHLNGYVRDGDELMMWVGRRARDRKIFPGALDQMVAGGLPHGIGLTENLLKECREEAGLPAALARKARPVGALTYNRTTDRGFRPDVLYCYDLELPIGFRPENTDGEVEEFILLPIEEVARLVRETDDFKLNCNLVAIDFLIRRGLIAPEHPEYLALISGMRPDLDSPMRPSTPQWSAV